MRYPRFLLPLLLSALPAFSAPASLFDGKTLEGWDFDPKVWRVEDGMITGGSTTEKIHANYFIATKKSYANFELRMKIKCSGDPKTGMINSGIQIRSMRVPGGTHMSGYQIDCGAGWFGKIYDEYRRNKVIANPVDQAALDKVVDVFGWNEYRIRAEGPRIQTWINGVLAIDYTETDPNIALEGQIGPQVHSGGVALVQVKDVTIEELPPTPGATTWESLGGVEGARAKIASPRKEAATTPAPKRDLSYNAVAVTAKTPEEERALLKVPDGFEVELVAAEDPANGIGKFVPIAFDQKGALWTTTALEYPVDGNENPAAADALYASKAKDKVLVFDRDPSQPTGYASQPRVFAEGLAIPLGVLPYKNGCYVQHGHDIAFLEDTDADGKADKRTVILTGFGVQDSHLFPHQFLRAPGGWIWMAQGAFNSSKVRRPEEPAEKAVQFDQTRMAKFRPDGSGFDITSNGPCNIWGLVLSGEGEAFIQEANDFGYPVMPLHEYANYPGCSDRQWKSYAPEFPGTAPDFRMGGTGLSGLALTDKAGPFPEPWRDMMLVANPITNRIQGIKMHRDGPRWRLDPPKDFLVSEDPWFRPVAITVGPDGCLYIVDWYNKIISHNEVPRNHPDRDKTRGRIWRVKAKAAKPLDVPDFTKLSGDELIAKLGGESLAQSHLAWQTLEDLGQADEKRTEKLRSIVIDKTQPVARRLQAAWAISYDGFAYEDAIAISAEANPHIRREAVKIMSLNWSAYELAYGFGHLIDDPDPQVRCELIRQLGQVFTWESGLSRSERDEALPPISPAKFEKTYLAIRTLLKSVKPPLAGPGAPSTHKPQRTIKVHEAYDREFERYLVRMSLEQHPKAVTWYLDSGAADNLPVEARLLATLALEPKASAARVAKLLPQLQRAPGQEEVLRLAQFPGEPGVGEALRAILAHPKTSAAALESLLAVKTKLDSAKLAPFLTDAATTLLASTDHAVLDLGVRLTSGFKLASAESALIALLNGERELPARPAGLPSPAAGSGAGSKSRAPAANDAPTTARQDAGQSGQDARAPLHLAALRALSEIGSAHAHLFAKLAETSSDPAIRDEALVALAASKAADAPPRLLALYPKLAPAQQRTALDKLSATKSGAAAIVGALTTGTVAKDDLDAATLDRLQAVLGPDDPTLANLVNSLGALFRPVLALDGSDQAWTQTNITLDGPCTIESWVRLDPQGREIGNSDSIAGAPGQLDFNFFGARARIYAFPPLNDVVVAKKPVTPGLWTHVAATRDAAGLWKIYIDGELDSTGVKPAPGKIENLRLAWNGAKGGTRGALSQLRLWNSERTADEIRIACDRSLAGAPSGGPPDGRGTKPAAASQAGRPTTLAFDSATEGWGHLQTGAKVIKTSDFPPILTPDEAAALDARYAKCRALAEKPGDVDRGRVVAAVCQACHLMGPAGGNIGPNLSGVGAMGTEAILRNILQPNAAMENGYRIYRVELKNGDIVDALFVSDDQDAVVVRMPGTDDRRIPRKDIRGTKYLRRSLMPEGMLDTMTPEQVSDLFAFLRTLK